MASYFDEHDCEPLGEGETPNHFLHLARLLLDTGLSAEWEMEYGRDTLCGITQGLKCPICLMHFDEEDELKVLPCQHQFHTKCIITWLQQVCSCPMCRQELPTDDPDYETFKKHKARAKQREQNLETLHDSMFG